MAFHCGTVIVMSINTHNLVMVTRSCLQTSLLASCSQTQAVDGTTFLQACDGNVIVSPNLFDVVSCSQPQACAGNTIVSPNLLADKHKLAMAT